MRLNRRQLLAAFASLSWVPCFRGPAQILPWDSGLTGAAKACHPAPGPRLGVASFSYHLRLAAERAAKKPGLADPLNFLDHCHKLGAGGVQLGLGTRDRAYTVRLRKQAEATGLFVEGSIRLPQDEADGERFTAE